ncbi:MAG: hypothetical protein U9R75_07550, partial [Candidatus Thermoplasmatota archaeon]|nr:hypothetical protein [Candidatus Thermoplasmatota archaeon]
IGPSSGTLRWFSPTAGNYTITVTATDGVETIEHQFTLTVNALPEVPDQTTDTDSDGMPDWWEEFYGLDPNNEADASADPDGDNITNLQEFKDKTSPSKDDRIPLVDDTDDDDSEGEPDDKQSSTMLYVITGVLAVLVLIMLILLLKRSGGKEEFNEEEIEE